MILLVESPDLVVAKPSSDHSYLAPVPNVPSDVTVTLVASPLQIVSTEKVITVGATDDHSL